MKKMDGFVEDGSGHDWDRTQSYQDNSAQNQLLFFQFVRLFICFWDIVFFLFLVVIVVVDSDVCLAT